MKKLHFILLITSILVFSFFLTSCKSIDKTINHDDDYHWYGLDDSNKEAHSYFTFVVQSPTCSVPGIMEKKCTVCYHMSQEEIACIEHTPSQAWRIDQENETHYHLCRLCGEKVSVEPHSFNTYSYDEQKHTLVCICGKENISIKHSFVESIVSEPDGNGSKGIKKYSCLCGYAYSEEFDTYLTKVEEIKNAIDLLTEDSSKNTINDLYAQISTLSSYYVGLIDNMDHLERIYDIVINDVYSKATEIETLIKNINKITDVEYSELQTISNKYDSLSEFGKELVNNYSLFVSISDTYYRYQSLLSVKDLKQLALYNTAMNYYYQGTSIQYDQSDRKRNMSATFNDAVLDKHIYLDCSSFVNSVYNMCFGEDVLPSTFVYSSLVNTSKYRININNSTDVSTENMNYYGLSASETQSSDFVLYVSCQDASWQNKTEVEKKSYIQNDLIANLQIGDLIIYRHYSATNPTASQLAYGTAGHVMMYIGNNNFIHCTGSSNTFTEGTTNPYSMTSETATTAEKTNGAIKIESVSLYYNSSSSRYLGKSDVSSFCVIRPINRLGDLNDIGKTMTWNESLDVEKTVSVGNYQAIVASTYITYNISIKNNSNVANQYLYVEQEIPTNTIFIRAMNDGYYDKTSNKIIWKVTLPKNNETLDLEFLVKASDDSGKPIENYHTYVNGIRANMLLNYTVKEDVLNKIDTKLQTAVASCSTNNYDSFTQACDAVYSYLGYKNLFTNVTSDKYMLTNTLAYFKLNSEATLINMVAGNLYGGTEVRKQDPTNNNTMRYMSPSFLEKGDIIVTQTTFGGDTYEYYIFVDVDTVYKFANEKLTLTYSNEAAVKGFVHTLPYFKRFVVLRPIITL